MRKTLLNILIVSALIVPLAFSPVTASEPEQVYADGNNVLATGYVPIPIDLSYLADNPPVEGDPRAPIYRDSPLPAKYDLRNVDGKSYLTPVKDQSTYGVCWAFAATGAMESNYKKNTGKDIDLAELHLAWFSFKNADKSKAFHNKSGNTLSAVLGGGNAFYPAALYSRLDGPILESDLPYPDRYASNPEANKPSETKADAYNRVLRLTDVYYLDFDYGGGPDSIGSTETSMNIIKRRIMETGSVVASYNSNNSSYYNYDTSSRATSYYVTQSGKSTNHAVQIVGWDDNFPASNFKTKPSRNGAWLIKNSWGTWWGDSGYFWMSYDQYLRDGTAFVVEEANDTMKAYYYDALGWTSFGSINAANVFKAERDETLTEAGFYVTNNNASYTISVYTFGNSVTSMPESPIPAGGSPKSTQSGSIAYAGYHTVKLNTPVTLKEGEYFSLVLKTNVGTATEEKTSLLGANAAVIEDGSFFSYNGTSWTASKTANACIKAFTVTDLIKTAPVIRTESLPEATAGLSYSAEILADGTRPMTWTISGLPSGLGYNASSGTISGTPTAQGQYTITVKAENSAGSTTKTLTLTVEGLPTLATTSFSGYEGYAFNETLKLSNTSITATWKNVDALPKGLKLDTKTGAITGKPSAAGTLSVEFKASVSSLNTTIPGTVKFNINEKPIPPKIGASGLPNGEINTEYSQPLKLTGTTPITVSDDGMPSGLAIKTLSGDSIICGTPEAVGTFNFTVTARNVVSDLGGKGEVTKKVKLVIVPKIVVVSLDDAVIDEEYTPVTFAVYPSANIAWKASGVPSGMTFNNGVLSGKPKGSAKTYNITLTATANGIKAQTGKIPLNVVMKPSLTTKKLSAGTDGKAYKAKLATKGNPTILKVSGLPDTLKFIPDGKGGGTIEGTPNSMGKYTTIITMTNAAGSTSASMDLEIKGVAPKITASAPKGNYDKDYTAKITATGTKPIKITYSISDKDKEKFGVNSLEELGLTLSADDSGNATITGKPTQSIKSLPVTITASNDVPKAKAATKKLSLTIAGDKPAFTTPSPKAPTYSNTAGEEVEIDFAVTGTPNITFTMSKAEGFTLTSSGNTAKLTGTPTKAGKTSITITAANADGKDKKKVVIETAVNTKSEAPAPLEVREDASVPEDNTAPAPEDDAQESQEVPELVEAPAGDSAVAFGAVRTVNSLEPGVLEMLEAEGYTIAAVLPEVTVSESGLHEISIKLNDETETGAKLYWFAFPKNAEPSEDDEISEFYDSTGAEIEFVPEERDITVSVWLSEGVTYAPVIAVKSEK